MAGFAYAPLQQNEIRLLRPTSVSNEDLAFDIVNQNLQAKPRYWALSYTWGAPIFSQKVYLNGQQFNITQNLHDALRRLTSGRPRKLPLIKKWDFLWADAICIDQGNTAERSQQVRLMRQLYEQAQKVYVWLGEPENALHNKLAEQKMKEFSFMQRRSMVNNASYRPWWWPKEAPKWQNDIYRPEMDINPGNKIFFDVEGSATHDAWLGILSLWRKPWWTRTWVIQEATMPEKLTSLYVPGLWMKPVLSKVVFLCGWSYIPWDDLWSATVVAGRLESSPDIDTDFMKDSAERCRHLGRYRNQRLQGQELSLLELMQTFRVTECQDPRDKVYAPLGLASSPVRQTIMVDYDCPVADVYMDLVQFLISQPGQELDFLGYTDNSGAQSSLPSWAPDWNQPIALTPLPKNLFIPASNHRRQIHPYGRRELLSQELRATKLHVYNASGNTSLKAFISGPSLCLGAVYCDTIIDTDPCPSQGKVHIWNQRAGGHCSATNEPFEIALRRTYAADVQYNVLRQACSRGAAIDFAFMQTAKGALELEQYERQNNMTYAYEAATGTRKLCQTRKGFVGLVPKGAVVGDRVYVFLGGQVLYTVRPDAVDEMKFTFVGECYLHGNMDGEVMALVQRGEARVEQLVIT